MSIGTGKLLLLKKDTYSYERLICNGLLFSYILTRLSLMYLQK